LQTIDTFAKCNILLRIPQLSVTRFRGFFFSDPPFSQKADPMTPSIKQFRCHLLVVVVFVLVAGLSMQRAGAQPQESETVAKSVGNWWSISDDDFVTQYSNLAVGTQEQQSQFAWMSFGRANQQVSAGSGQQMFSKWELWADDPDTFSPD